MRQPPALDTLQAVRDMTKTGMSEDTAEAVVTLINRAVADTAATFFDLSEVKTQLGKEREVQNAELRAELAAIRTKIAKSDGRILTLFGAAASVIVGLALLKPLIVPFITDVFGLVP